MRIMGLDFGSRTVGCLLYTSNTMIGMQTMINSSVDAVDVMGDMVSSSMDMVTEALQYLSCLLYTSRCV